MTVQVKRNVWLELEPKVSGSYVNLLPVTGVIGYAQPVMTQEYVSNLLDPKVRICITKFVVPPLWQLFLLAKQLYNVLCVPVHPQSFGEM